MTEINIIKIDGKPLEKLIGVISIWAGKIYKPKEIRKVAEAEAYKMEVTAKAQAKSRSIIKESDLELNLKIQARIDNVEKMRQNNIENVTYKTAELLQDETSVSDEQVDEDWISRFFTTVQDISNEEMQKLWSRILAGEIKRPNSFSLRTLDFLKNLSQEDARLLVLISKYKLRMADAPAIYYTPIHSLFRDKWGLQYPEFLYLVELGIINSTVTQFNPNAGGNELWVYYGKKVISFNGGPKKKKFSVVVNTFTKVGGELLKLIEEDPNQGYLKEFVAKVRSDWPEIIVKVRDEIGVDDKGEKVYDSFKPYQKES
jgi:hypothetical protein